MNPARRLTYSAIMLLGIISRTPSLAAGNLIPEDETRHKLETTILDPSSIFQENGTGFFPDETAVFLTKTLNITESKFAHKPLALFCGTFSESGKQLNIEDYISDDICGVFDLEKSLVYILSGKARQNPSIRHFPLSKTTDFILLDGTCGYSCEGEGLAELFTYNGITGNFNKIWSINTYRHTSADGPDSSSDYIDRGTLSEGIRGNENMREIVLTINREDMHSEPPQDIKEIKEWYSWKNGRPYLAQRTENNQLVLDREAGERLYAVSQIDVSTSAPGRMALIDYLGDKNPMVAAAADHKIFSHMYNLEKTDGLDYTMIHELVRSYLDKNSPSSSSAGNLLSHFRSFDGFSLTREDKDLLWNIFSSDSANDYVLLLLSSAGDERPAQTLVTRFRDRIEQKNACAADEVLSYVYAAAKQGVVFSDDFRKFLEETAGMGLVCQDEEVNFDIAYNIKIVLPILQRNTAGNELQAK